MSNSYSIQTPCCRICGAGESHQSIKAHTVFGGGPEHKFWQCNICDAVYLYPIPSIEEEKKFYTQEFEKFMDRRSGEDRDWSSASAHIATNQDQVQRRWPFLEPYLKAGLDLLEIGCSSGFMLDAFRDAGLQCVGVDPSGGFLDFLHSRNHKVYQSIEELEEKNQQKFDLIVHFFVLEHIRDPYTFFQESLELLKEGGKVIAEIPCINDPLVSLYKIPAFDKFYWSIAHHYYYSPKSLAYVLDHLNLAYDMFPEQRYDLSNHIIWMLEGKSGGQGKFNHIFSQDLIEQYKKDLKQNWLCDTIFLVIYK